MPYEYFSLIAGTTFTSIVNVETFMTRPPTVLEGRLLPIRRPTRWRNMLGASVERGARRGVWRFDIVTMSEIDALESRIAGTTYPPSTTSAQVAIIALDEYERWTPFTAYADLAQANVEKNILGNGVYSYELPLFGLSPVSATKTSNTTLTANERLVLGDTTSGNVTLTLCAASAVQANTPVRIRKVASANTLTIQRGGSDLVNGAASALTRTAINSEYTLVSDGVSAWRTI